MTSTSSKDYAFGNKTNITGTMYDWGLYCAISNGGGTTGAWFTLSYNEFYYMIVERSRASSLRAFATVNNVAGMILLPDNWVLPTGMTFTPQGTAADVTNIYTASQWKIMEAAGAVFLPAAGENEGSYGVMGDYWTSSNNGGDTYYNYYYAYHLDFNAISSFGYFFQRNTTDDHYYMRKSVRLVQVVQ